MFSFYCLIIAGLVLIALELATTTFYLLVIGVSSLLASIVALYTHTWIFPIICAGVFSVVGCFFVSKYKVGESKMMVNHIGKHVEVVEVHKDRLRVIYSGSYWDANVVDISKIKVGDKLAIKKILNNELFVE